MRQYRDWFRLASHLGLPLDQCMKTHTERQLSAWLRWLDDEYENPSRTDWYLMRIAQRIQQFQQAFGKSAQPISMEDQKVKFESADLTQKESLQKDSSQNKDRQALSKSSWISAVSGSTKNLVVKGRSHGHRS